MKALTWQGRRDVRVDTVPDPTIEQPTDAIIRVTSTGLCGSDLHLYEVLGPFLEAGDVLGHEPMGDRRGGRLEVDNLRVGDRVVVPFNISCGHCFMCEHGLQTSARRRRTATRAWARALRLHEALRRGAGRPGRAAARAQAHYGPIKVPEGPPDDRFLFLSDVLPTAWQAVRVRPDPDGGSVAVIGLGRSARCRRGSPSTWAPARSSGSTSSRAPGALEGPRRGDDRRQRGRRLPAAVRELTDGRGPDAVIDAVGMEAHGARIGKLAHTVAGLLPDRSRAR
jgi:threonine dehydrogenase-like Zn-dependent dehydrogenase